MKPKPIKNDYVNADLLDTNKCSVYYKTSGKRHRLCLGQSKKCRRWRLNNEVETISTTEQTLITGRDSVQDATLIFPLEEEENLNCTGNSYPQTLITGRDSVQDPTLIFPLEEEKNLNCTGNSYPQTLTISSSHINTKSILSGLPIKRTYHCPNERQSVKIVSSSLSDSAINNQVNSNSTQSGKKKILKRKHESRRGKILAKLKDTKMLQNLIKRLDQRKLTKDFLFAIRAMSSGAIPIDTIPHLAFLDSVRFRRIKKSFNMTYSQKMKKFWHCFYKVGGGPALRLLSGPKGTGDNTLDTASCSINFAVPSLKTLKQVDTVVNRIIHPGIFHDVLDNISLSTCIKNKEFILSFDGKSVGPGLREDTSGDVNLWNFETEPNLNLARERLEREHEILSSISSNVLSEDFDSLKTKLCSITKMITLRIKDIREIIDKCKKTELKYKKADLENPKYRMKHQYSIQGAQYLSDNCKAIIKRALQLNKELSECCAKINGTGHCINHSGIVEFSKQPNIKTLLPPETISDFFDSVDNTIFVKQRSEVWFRIRDMCHVTGSTLHNAIGYGTLQQQKDHFDQKFNNKPIPPHSAEVQEMMTYGTENEVRFHG